MAQISFIISMISLLLSLYVFIKHDRKLKTQQKKLNELALQKATMEEVTRKQAVIFLNYKKISNKNILVITNKGMATAFDIKISSQIDNDPLKAIWENQLHWDSLKSGQEVQRTISLAIGEAIQVTYDIYWRDDLGEHYDKQLVDYLE